LSNVLTLDPVAAESEAPIHRRLRPLSRALAWLFTMLLVLFTLYLLAGIVVALFFSAHVQMNAEGATVSFSLHGVLPPPIPGTVRLSDQSLITRLSGVVDLVIAMAPVIFIFWHLRELFRLYAAGTVFARENAQHLKHIGIWLIAYPFAKFAANMLFQLAGGVDHHWFYMIEVYALVLGIIVVAIAQVMEFGHEIEQEKDSFI
jgi:hypothetical protein